MRPERQIDVFVNNVPLAQKFNARHACSSRIYEYYLPASLLGKCECYGSHLGVSQYTRPLPLKDLCPLPSPPPPSEQQLDGGQADIDRIALFRKTLRAFIGSHPFHNYTSMRQHDGARQYTKDFIQVQYDGCCDTEHPSSLQPPTFNPHRPARKLLPMPGPRGRTLGYMPIRSRPS